MVAGCRKWLADGLGLPKAVSAATTDYRAAEDVLAAFVSLCCETVPGGEVSSTTLLQAYKTFSSDYEMNAKRFAGLLQEKGFENAKGT